MLWHILLYNRNIESWWVMEIQKYQEKIFEDIKHINEFGEEYWEARELMKVLGYRQWRNFNQVIDKAKISCSLSKMNIKSHFADVSKIVKAGVTSKEVQDYHLTRYACYLIVQNGDSRKEVIALGQSYFAVQTRKMELTEEEFFKLDENQKRLYTRMNVRNKSLYLFQTAKNAGVKNYGKFNNYGYQGLYNEETAVDIARRKGIKETDDILDYMGSEELGANLFRITQTDAKLKRDQIHTESDACDTHYVVGLSIRKTIYDLGGTMPEELPTPDASIEELEQEELKRINGGCYALLM